MVTQLIPKCICLNFAGGGGGKEERNITSPQTMRAQLPDAKVVLIYCKLINCQDTSSKHFSYCSLLATPEYSTQQAKNSGLLT